MNYYTNIHHAFAQHPLHIALRWPGQGIGSRWTFGELQQRVETHRQTLRQKGVGPGDICLMLIPASAAAISGILAVMAEGAIPMLPPPGMKWKHWRALHQQHKITAYLIASNSPRAARGLAYWGAGKRIRLDPKVQTNTAMAPTEVPDAQPGLISHSSGSTGMPKAIFRTHGVLRSQHAAINRVFPAWEGQVDFPLFPNVLLHNLAVGTQTVMPDLPGFQLTAMDPVVIARQLAEAQAQTMTGNVYYFRQLVGYLEAQGQTLNSLRAVGVGGSPVPDALLARMATCFPEATIYAIYGSSEAEPIAVRPFTAPMDPTLGYFAGPIDATLTWRLHEPQTLQAGGQTVQAGELWVKGPHVVGAEEDRWFKTGDIGYVTEDGLYLTGRIGNETAVADKMHYQVEHFLNNLPGITRAAALPRQNQFAIAYEGTLSEQEVLEKLEGIVTLHKINRIVKSNGLPVDHRHHSKILYRQIRL